MTPVSVPGDVLNQTFHILRECGRARQECVVYWTAMCDEPSRVTEVVHPDHAATVGGYRVDSGWVNKFFLDLRRLRRTVTVQVHTHPGAASHSETDDEYALAPATGFISLVIPDFAMGEVDLARVHAVVMTATGSWSPVPAEEILTIER